jgi:N-acyl-D-aspartate/D-glutamate deacylase
MYDLVIRGARLADGAGSPLMTADLAVEGRRIAEIGKITERGRREIAADGLLLGPGLIDTHTHYDAQLTWDPTASPSPALGVTTVVMGNCGFSLAPCPVKYRDLIARNLAEVEGMSLKALRQGIAWGFESFAEYLAVLRRGGCYPNVAAFVGHSTVRSAVMGEEASIRPARPDELERMRALVEESIGAGAIGVASTTHMNHYGHGGVPMPSRLADDHEFQMLMGVLGKAKRGLFQMTVGPSTTMPFLEELAQQGGRPVIVAAANYNAMFPDRALAMLDACRDARGRGAELYAQVNCQPLSMDFPLTSAYPMYGLDAWEDLRAVEQPEDFRRAFNDAGFRQRFRADLEQRARGRLFNGEWEKMEIAMAARSENRPLEGRPLSELAAERGRHPADFMFDIALAENLETVFTAKLLNSEEDGVEPLLRHDFGIISLSDGGAHLRYMCDAAYGLHLFGHWVRERGSFSIEDAIHRLTGLPAKIYRIAERGLLKPGAFADLLLFDPTRVARGKLRRVDDLPGAESRFVRDPIGVHGVWVNGTQVFNGRDYVAEKAPPGQVLDRFSA